VESEPGQGAVFLVELPVEEPPLARTGVRVAEELPPIRGKAILIVDDEPEVGSVLGDLLSADGHQVEIAANGALALEKLQERAYDLILSDIKMPELDGPGLYREVEHRHPELLRRFIFITGDALSPETSKFLETTRVPSLQKPFNLLGVRRVVQRALRSG
jgi:CheY-like chemotaxis protein